MKRRIGIFLFMAIILLVTTSCQKFAGDSGVTEYLIFKYKNIEYANYVCVRYSDKKNKVVGHPGTDLRDARWSNPASVAGKCSDGYYIIAYDTPSLNPCMTNITFSEYVEIGKATVRKDIRDTLTTRVIDRDPIKELYRINSFDTLLIVPDEQRIWGPNIDKINEMIESGEFFTYEGVERVK